MHEAKRWENYLSSAMETHRFEFSGHPEDAKRGKGLPSPSVRNQDLG